MARQPVEASTPSPIQSTIDQRRSRRRPAPCRTSNGRSSMASNEPAGDNHRVGAVKKRTQRKGKLMGKTAWTKRDKRDGKFMAVKKGKKKFKGVRREKAA